MNHIKCTTEENKSWCDEELDASFSFKDTEAAVINGAMNGTLVPCEKCISHIIFHLRKGDSVSNAREFLDQIRKETI